jgi:hypothetical protein
MKNKKKIIKKNVDIESEFVGIPVGTKVKKEKKCDLTDEIEKFLSSQITLESICEILLRLEGRWIADKSKIAKIKIYGLSSCGQEVDEFFIKIKSTKFFDQKYYLTSGSFYNLRWVAQGEKLDKSILRQELRGEIWKWLCNNLDQVKIIPS